MSAVISSNGRVNVRTLVAMLAGGVLIALAFSAFNASSASAAPTCTGENITGRGASFQKIAQQNVWDPGFETSICNKGTEPKITYESTGSGGCISAWNFDGISGVIDKNVAYCATDDAPTAAQITNAEKVAGGARIAVVPVAQSSLAIIANPPVGCNAEFVTNSNLAGLMEGRIRNWNKVETAEEETPGACNAPISRVVRKDGSGTTYQFKNYLFKLFNGTLKCTEGLVEAGKKATWQQLEPIAAEGKPNISWPESCPEQELSTLLRGAANGNGAVVTKVNETPGSIAYTGLADAVAGNKGNTRILALQNNGQKGVAEATFAEPGIGNVANCGKAVYQVPKVNGSLDFDWSQVFAAKPAIGGEAYPLCTLTYVLVWNDYSAVGYTEGVATTTRDYIYEYVVQAAGQAAIDSNNYSALPGSGNPQFDVLGAAQKAAKNIAF